jgi:hypothetical protein
MRGFLVALAVLAVGLAGAQDQQRIPFKVMPEGQILPHVEKFTVFVLHNEADWKRYWSTVSGDVAPDGKPLPIGPSNVDWKTTEVVAIHLGVRPNGPYKVQVTSVSKNQEGYSIAVTEVPPHGMAFMHTTYPYVAIEVPSGVEKANVRVLHAPMQRGSGARPALAPGSGGA